jgi:hypothetical protein
MPQHPSYNKRQFSLVAACGLPAWGMLFMGNFTGYFMAYSMGLPLRSGSNTRFQYCSCPLR